MSKFKRIYIIQGLCTNISPLFIGKGEGDFVDREVVKDAEGKPFIPATSFIGVIRHTLENDFELKGVEKEFLYLFGAKGESVASEEKYQSHIIVDDLTPLSHSSVAIRDGIKIGAQGVVEEGKKFDYEIVEPGARFFLNMEVKVREGFNVTNIEKILKTVLELLQEGLAFGAYTTKGFGKVKFSDLKIYKFEFPKDKESYFSYLDKGTLSEKNTISLEAESLNKKKKKSYFSMEAEFSIKNSLVIGGGYSEEADKAHLKSNNENVLPGTSLKGVLRTRAEAIIGVLSNSEEKVKEFINPLFGFTDENAKKKSKSRIIIEETHIKETKEAIHQRIRIDRFTGAVCEGALFNTQALWGGKAKISLKIKEPKEEEIGLCLLLLKDLWTGDLPLGGEKAIGRGVLKGISAKLDYDGQKWIIKETEDGKLMVEPSSKKEELEKFVEKLREAL